MKQFALIIDGRVAEVLAEFIQIEAPVVDESGEKTGTEVRDIPLSERYTPEFIAQLVEYNPANPPAEPQPSTPAAVTSVSMRQARLALLATGRLAAVASAINVLPAPQREVAQIEWEFAQTVDRDSALLVLLSRALQLSDQDLDDLFTTAAAL